MTHARIHDVRGPGAILARLLVVLALGLFGVPQGHAHGSPAQGDPAAQARGEQADGIVPMQRHLLRAHLADDLSPDSVAPDTALTPWQSRIAATMSPASRPSLLPAATPILPPVRGPPAA